MNAGLAKPIRYYLVYSMAVIVFGQAPAAMQA
jgi:hypothetical protein